MGLQPVAPGPSGPRPTPPRPIPHEGRFTLAPDASGPVAHWWTPTEETIGSGIAAHDLAYLGVLLLFVGVFGLVAFAFGDVAQTARPIAEVGIVVAPFAASFLLLGRGAVVAGRALGLAGGLLLPVIALTSFLDGVPVPPDLLGQQLVVVLTTVAASISGVYAVWSLRHEDSALRYLVAPVAWLAVAIATLGVGRETPSGKAVAAVTAAQAAAISVAMLVSLAWARMRPSGRLSAPTVTAAVPGS